MNHEYDQFCCCDDCRDVARKDLERSEKLDRELAEERRRQCPLPELQLEIVPVTR